MIALMCASRIAITHHRAVREPSMAQHSSRWLNRGAVALLFACASFVRPVLGAPSTPLASLRPVLAPHVHSERPLGTMHVPTAVGA